MPKRKLLALCDSPSVNSGFSRVANNLLAVWQDERFFDQIDVFAIGYQGDPHDYPYRLWPAAPASSDKIWWEKPNLQRFINLASRAGQDYTHVWMMHDLHSLRPLAEPLLEMRKVEEMPRSFLYYPVDAPIRPDWVQLVESVDLPVSYTEYGRGETERAFRAKMAAQSMKGQALEAAVKVMMSRVDTLPHGSDPSVYYPLGDEVRREARAERFGDVVGEDDLLIVNVNTHQRRKGLWQTMQIFSRLRAMGGERAERWRLYLHMPRKNVHEGTDLAIMAEELGIPPDTVLYGDEYYFGNLPKMPESTLNEIYNCADLVLSTTHGEGWGLTITEAMTAGRPVAAPLHTAMLDYFDESVGIPLPCGETCIILGDQNRPRPMVDPEMAAAAIDDVFAQGAEVLDGLGQAARQKMKAEAYDWRHIAHQWMERFDSMRSTT